MIEFKIKVCYLDNHLYKFFETTINLQRKECIDTENKLIERESKNII